MTGDATERRGPEEERTLLRRPAPAVSVDDPVLHLLDLEPAEGLAARRIPLGPAPLTIGRSAQNGLAPEYGFRIWSPFLEHLDREVVAMWQCGDWADFCAMLPEYAVKGHGEGFMHDTAMLLGLLGWSAYDGRAEIVTPYFGASGTGQINAVFPVTPQDGRAVPQPIASRAQGYTAVSQRL